MLKFILIFSFISVISAFRYDNYTLYSVNPKTELQLTVLQKLSEVDFRFDFWSDPISLQESVRILSSPADKSYLEGLLKSYGLDFDIAFSNIQELIDSQAVKKQAYVRGNPKNLALNVYHTNEEINDWLDDLAASYPDIVTPLNIGKSYEGRDIKGIKISHGEGKKAVFFEAGIHAREWISPATVIYMINELLTSDHEETKAAARDFDWYIFPVTNPDGYVWTHTDFRLWRKNRRPNHDNTYGVDLNRNWNNNWLVIGASSNPASETYAGLGPFSEPETLYLSNYLRTIADKIDLYVSFHNSGQLLLLPFGNTTEPLANYYDSINIGRRAMGALSVRYGTPYTTGNVAEAIYHAAGCSIDWVKEELKVPIVYTYELRDKAGYGFLLPPEQIIPSGEETWDSILEIIYQGRRFGYFNSGMKTQGSLLITALMIMFAYLY